MERKQNQSLLETKYLAAIGVGIFCPIPVVGEVSLAYGLTPILKETGLFKDNPATTIASLAIAALTRLELYGLFYSPVMDRISKSF